MDTPIKLPLTDDTLHALLDGELAPATAEAIHRLVDQDPALLARLQDLRRQHETLQRLHRDVLREEPPAHLMRAARGLSRRRDQGRRWGLGLAIAASWLLAFGVGWSVRPWASGDSALGGMVAQWGGHGSPPSPTPLSFVHQAAAAYAVYSPEVKHPVEVTADQQEHLVQWLSKRLGRPLKVPQLGPLGYELVGGRLLPGDEGARALFMYQGKGGERVTLYVGSRPEALQAGSVEFRFSSDAAVPSFYWVDRGYSYALSGRMDRGQLLQLAEAVDRQLN